MTRSLVTLALLAVCLAPVTAFAGDEKKAHGPPPVATDAEAADALAIFKVNWKARGLKGDDKLSQRDWALRQIAPIQHPDIIKAIGKVSRSGDGDLRLLALIYLADQKAHPHLAAKHVLDCMRRNKKDIVLVMTGLQTLGELKYLGAKQEIAALLKHNYFVIRKTAITTVGDIGDVRLLKDVLKLLGIKTEQESGADDDKSSGGKETTQEGYSWEGASAEVDRGESDNTQENADAKKQAEAKIAANKAAAQAKAGGGGAGAPAGSSGGGGGGRGAQSRSPKELVPAILRTLKKLTGEDFDKPSTVRRWLKEHRKDIEEREKKLDAAEKAQKSK